MILCEVEGVTGSAVTLGEDEAAAAVLLLDTRSAQKKKSPQ